MMNVGVPEIIKFVGVAEDDQMDRDEYMPARAKKRRLDHLSWEEKIQRKKLKNRVAAQTSRDRKKAKMEQMEAALKELFTRNETLLTECESLKAMNEDLRKQNEELQKRISGMSLCAGCSHSRFVECETGKGPAASTTLLPKGPASHSAATVDRPAAVAALVKILFACLLYRTCSTNCKQTSTSMKLKSLPKVYSKISSETLKQLLKNQIMKNPALLDNCQLLPAWWGKHQNSWNPVSVKG